jgi:Mce-associated membrane protein
MTVTEEAEVPESAAPTRSSRVLTIAVAVAAVVTVVMGGLWVMTLNDDGRELAQARDAVLVDARQAAININSLDSGNVDAGLDLWEQSSTGTMLEEFRANREEYGRLVAESGRTTSATVPDAAVAELDLRAGTARVLVGVDVEVTVAGQEPQLVRQRLQMEMTRTGEGWKAERAEIVR